MLRRFSSWLAYNLWYFRRPPWDTGISPPELLRFIAEHPPGRALDLGCGTGTNVVTLSQAGWQVTGVDFAFPAIAAARRRVKKGGLSATLILGDVTDLRAVAGSFELILDIGCFHALSPEQRIIYVKNIQRLLALNGFWLVYAFRNDYSAGVGIKDAEINSFKEGLHLIRREDSLDRRGRPATWLLFCNSQG